MVGNECRSISHPLTSIGFLIVVFLSVWLEFDGVKVSISRKNGIQHRGNSWQDEVYGTSCPIPPGKNFTYALRVKNQIGGFFYFPSLGMHKAAEGFGGIRIWSCPLIPVPFPPPAGDFTILVGDWFKIDHHTRCSLLMFVATYLTFITSGGFPSFVEEMKVFERERLNGHYGVTAYIIGQTLSAIPYLLLISLIPGAIVYYLTALHPGCQHFIYFTCVLFISIMLVESLMMIVASMIPNFLMGIITGAGILGVMMLGGGFYRLPSDLPKPFWRYPLYYISIHKYAYQGLFKNEFEGLTLTKNHVGEPMNISGEEMLQNLWQMEMGLSKWVDISILLGMVVLYRILFLVIIKSIEKVKPIVAAFK